MIGVCVVGSGRAGMIHARNFAANVPEAKLIAMVDPVEDVLQASCRELGIENSYSSYEKALDNKDIDAFIVVSPTKFHMQTVKDLAYAGKHVLCEKPMAMNEEECDVMIRASEENNTILQIGFMRRYESGFMHAKEIVDSGEIGDVVMVRSNTRGPSIPQPWMYDIKVSNGPLAEVSSHDIDALRWFTGSEFESVFAIGGNYRCPDAKQAYPDFYDNVVMVASFKNGMQGMIDGAQGVGYAYDSRVEILGTKGCVFIGRMAENNVVICTADSKHGRYPLVGSWQQLFETAYLNEDKDFINCILTGKTPKATGFDGKMAVKVVNAGNKSIIEKQKVMV